MISRRTVIWLVGGTLVLPIALVLILALARLLGAMDDDSGQVVLDRVALGLGIVWAIDLVALVVVLGINSLAPPGEG